jgi:pilus assembly protein Flp/PilA
MKIMKDFWIDESGQGMVEYALIIALIAVALIASVVVFGGRVRDLFQSSSDEIGG